MPPSTLVLLLVLAEEVVVAVVVAVVLAVELVVVLVGVVEVVPVVAGPLAGTLEKVLLGGMHTIFEVETMLCMVARGMDSSETIELLCSRSCLGSGVYTLFFLSLPVTWRDNLVACTAPRVPVCLSSITSQ